METLTAPARPLPWAALGHQFAKPTTSTKALRTAAGLDWEPITEPQYRKRGDVFELVPGFKYVSHSKTGAVLDSATDKYAVFGHEEMLNVAQDLLSVVSGKGVTMEYVAGGPLYGGKRVWLCAQLGEELYLPGDKSPYVRHVVLSNNHDGHGALKVLPVEHRIFCANSIHRAEMDAAGRMAAFTFKHTSGISKRVDDAKKAMAASIAQLSKVEQMATGLLGITLSRSAQHAIMEEHALQVVMRRDLKGITSRNDAYNSPVVMSAVNATVAQLEMLLHSPTNKGIENTAWGMYQAMVEQADHMRPSTVPDRYVVRTVIDRNPDKQAGFQVIQALHRN